MLGRRKYWAATMIAALAVVAVPGGRTAKAAPPIVQMPTDEAIENDATAGPFGFLSNLSRSNVMLGDMWGLRSTLSRYGINLAIQETSEVLGNVTGGSRRGADYDGLTQII